MTLQLDLDAAAYTGADGDTIGASIGTGFPDVSGWGREFRQSTSGARPTFRRSICNGLPGVLFDGTDDYMVGQGTLSQYYGAAAFAVLCVFAPRSFVAATTPPYNTAGVFTDSGGYTGLFCDITPRCQGYIFDGADQGPSPQTIRLNQVVVASFYLSGGTCYLSVNGSSYNTDASGAPSVLTGVPRIGANHSGSKFFGGAIARLRIWNAVPADLADQYAELLTRYGVQKYAGLEEARDRGSRELRAYRRPVAMVSVRVPYSIGLGLLPGDLVSLAHPVLPAADGAGAGAKVWERWWCRVVAAAVSPAGYVDLTLRDVRSSLLSLWWVPHSPVSGLVQQQGVARILSGQTWTFARASAAWCADPADGRLLEASVDQEAIDAGGCLAEGASTNMLLNCAAADGTTTSWTGLVGCTASTSYSACDPGISRHSFALAFSPGTPAEQTQAVVSGGAQYWCLSAYHIDTASGALDWRLQRSVDSKYYNATTNTWDASSATVNFFATATTMTRHFSRMIDAGAAAGTLTLRLRNGVAGTVYVGHVQLEAARHPSSPIVTRATTVTRAAGQILVTNNSAARVWNGGRGTVRVTLDPYWTSSEIGSQAFTLLWISYDGSNNVRVWYDGSAGAWKFTRTAAGSATTASVVAAVTRGTPVEIVAEWIGSDGELDLAQYTQRIYADGVAGTDAVAAADPTQVASCNLEVGSGNSAYAWGKIRRLLITPLVLTTEQIARAD